VAGTQGRGEGEQRRVPVRGLPAVAQLRVYEPLAAWEEPERSRWAARADRAREDHLGVDAAERRVAFTAVLATPPRLPEDDGERGAYVLDVDGITCVCPWDLELRVTHALARAQEELPAPLLAAAVPPALRAQVGPPRLAPVHVRDAAWHVPVTWFVLVEDAERELLLGDARRLSYRTPMSAARRRAAHALRAVRDALPGSDLAIEVEDLARWLEEFHPRAVVELDYAGLVDLLPDESLVQDRSAAEVARGLAALAAGDEAGALGAYEQLLERWRPLEALASAS
jgi:hypothetical protein